MAAPANFMAQDDYLVTQAELLTDLDRKTLVYLYQPLIGAVASALYGSLWAQVKQHPMFTQDRRAHTNLLATLAISLDELYDARVRLEAVGLIKTYTQFDTARHYVYEMYAPLRPEEFFADDLFSVALYDTVGEERYREISASFTVTPVRRSDMHDISKKFTDVFHVTAEVTAAPATVREVRTATARPVKPVAAISKNHVDWELLTRQLDHVGLADGQLAAHQHAITQIAGFYGLDTSSLSRLIERSLDLLTGEISDARLRREAEQTYSKPGTSRLHATSAAIAAAKVAHEQTEPEAATTPAQADTPKFSAAELTVLQQAKTLPTREFLEVTKKAKDPNMFVADNERFAVEGLLERNVFNAATLNVLVYYVLQNRASISAAYLNSVANGWIRDKVDTPEKALVEIQTFKAVNAAKSGQGHRRSNYGRQQRKEPVPDWAKADYKAPTGPISDSAKKAIAEARARLQNSGKGDS